MKTFKCVRTASNHFTMGKVYQAIREDCYGYVLNTDTGSTLHISGEHFDGSAGYSQFHEFEAVATPPTAECLKCDDLQMRIDELENVLMLIAGDLHLLDNNIEDKLTRIKSRLEQYVTVLVTTEMKR